MKAAGTVGPCAALLLVVTSSLVVPAVFASQKEENRLPPANVCTSERPLTLVASTEHPVRFACPQKYELSPSETTLVHAVEDDGTCGTAMELATLALGAALEVKTKPSEEVSEKEYSFTVSKLPAKATSICYKCVLAPSAPTPTEGPRDEEGLPGECQVKITIPTEPTLTEREALVAQREVTETSTATPSTTTQSGGSTSVCPAVVSLISLTLVSLLF